MDIHYNKARFAIESTIEIADEVIKIARQSNLSFRNDEQIEHVCILLDVRELLDNQFYTIEE